MAEVDARIPLMVNTDSPFTLQSFLGIQNAVRQNYAQNRLRSILSSDGAMNASGMPTSDTIKQVLAVDPQYGMQLAQYSEAQALKEVQAQKEMLAMHASQEQQIGKAKSNAFSVYGSTLSTTGSEKAAFAAMQQAYHDSLRDMSSSGLFSPEQLDAMPSSISLADARASAITPDAELRHQDSDRNFNLATQRLDFERQLAASGYHAVPGVMITRNGSSSPLFTNKSGGTATLDDSGSLVPLSGGGSPSQAPLPHGVQVAVAPGTSPQVASVIHDVASRLGTQGVQPQPAQRGGDIGQAYDPSGTSEPVVPSASSGVLPKAAPVDASKFSGASLESLASANTTDAASLGAKDVNGRPLSAPGVHVMPKASDASQNNILTPDGQHLFDVLMDTDAGFKFPSLGYGNSGTVLRQQVLNGLADGFKKSFGSDWATKGADEMIHNQGALAGYNKLWVAYGNSYAWMQSADELLERAKEQAKGLNLSKYRTLNAVFNAAREEQGNTKLVDFSNTLYEASLEYAKATTGQFSSAGLSDSAREEVRRMLDQNYGNSTLQSLFQNAHRNMQARLNGFEKGMDAIMSNIKYHGQSIANPAGRQNPTQKPGKVITGIDWDSF